MSRDQIIVANPLADYLRNQGIQLYGNGDTLTTNRCPKMKHKVGHLCVTVTPSKNLFHCNDCDCGGTILDWRAIQENRSVVDVLRGYRSNGSKPTEPRQIIATYDYHDETGKLLFQCVRYRPKAFRQRRPDGNGGWIWNIEGVRRVLYRLPELLRDMQRGSPVIVVEGEKDVDAVAKSGFPAAVTCNPLGACKWREEFSEILRGATVFVIGDKDKDGRKHVQEVTKSLHRKAKRVAILELPDRDGHTVKDVSDWIAAGGTVGDLAELLETALEWLPNETPPIESGRTDDLQRAFADARPKIRLPGADRLLSDFAADLVQVLRDKEIYCRNGEIVTLTDGDLKLLTPQTFRCWAEKFFVGYRAKIIGENSFVFNVTMSDAEARGTLAAPQFTDALRRIRRVNQVRLPIIGADGKLALLPEGYHAATETLTLQGMNYNLDMPLHVAVDTIRDLISEFRFADGERSQAVSVAATMGLFANQLVPEKSLRPCFILLANAEGAGKTLLAQICMVPTLGSLPIGTKADDEDEVRKAVLTAVREARSVIFMDNLKGRLSSGALEAFLSAPIWSDRKLGVNESITGDNLATVFITGNGLTVSPDIRRRSLFVELHLEDERAEDRKFQRLLDLPTLLEMRPKVLAALWAMVREWDGKDRPLPSRGHSAFSSWAKIVGGIVEASGFACPLATADIVAAADSDGEDMRQLVKAMAVEPTSRAFAELIELAHAHGLFENIIGTNDDGELGRREKTTFSRMLTRYDRRLVLNYRFIVEGKGKTRRYKAEKA
jgi:hypothetical protein